MSWKDHSRANFAVQAISNILDSHGLDPNLCLRGTGLTVEKVLDYETVIPNKLEVEIIERALSFLPDQAGYGIRAGRSLRITNFGVWGLAILTSPDIRSALEAMARFSELSVTVSKVSLRESGERLSFIIDMGHLPKSVHRFMFERYVSMTLNFLREVVPDFDFDLFELSLPFQDPIYERQLAELTALRVHSGEDEYCVSVSKKLLGYPFNATDPLAHSHFLAECESMLKEQKSLPDYAHQIRNYVLREKNFSPKLGVVAKVLCLSDRTLRRRLQEEGHSFNQVVLDTKMTLAKELLLTTSLPVKVVAERLDYSESASFVRAFKKWSGVSPAKIKQLE